VPGNPTKMAAAGRESSPTRPPEGLSAAACGRKFEKIPNIKYNGKRYFLTSLGLGLCSAQIIRSRIVGYVLGLNKEIAKATDHYIDDIIVNTEAIEVKSVVAHLTNFGLNT